MFEICYDLLIIYIDTHLHYLKHILCIHIYAYAVIAEVMEDVIVVRRKAAAAIPQLCGYCAGSIVTSSFYLEFVRQVCIWLVFFTLYFTNVRLFLVYIMH